MKPLNTIFIHFPRGQGSKLSQNPDPDRKGLGQAAALRTVQLAPGSVVALSSALSLLSRIPTCWSQALELMRGAFPTKLNVVSYGAAIAACGGYGGRWAAALMLFDQLSPQSLQPNLVTFNGYLSALQKAARWVGRPSGGGSFSGHGGSKQEKWWIF